jgi:hypothetical protein
MSLLVIYSPGQPTGSLRICQNQSAHIISDLAHAPLESPKTRKESQP